jgi:hypothetical protein
MTQATGYASIKVEGNWYDLRDEGNQALVANLFRQGSGIQEFAEIPYNPPICHIINPHIPHGVSTKWDGDYQRVWFAFPASYSTFDVIRWLRDHDIEYRATHCYHDYDCCGRWYSDGVWITRKGSRTLAVINWSRNV